MIFRRIYTDQTYWFCVFRSEQTTNYVLYAVLKERDWPEVAIRLTPEEVAMFCDSPADFVSFARNFILSHNSSLFSARKISFRTNEPDLLETA
jgi:hypothetical protein